MPRHSICRYIPIPMNISEQTGSGLIKGGSISVPLNEHKGDDLVYLTKQQVKRLVKAHKSNRNIKLKMSPSQIRYNAVHGQGLFGDLAKTLHGYAKKAYHIIKGHVQPHIGTLAKHGLDTANKVIRNQLDRGHAHVAQQIDNFAHRYGTGVSQHPMASGLDDKDQLDYINYQGGFGFWEDLWGGIKDVGKTAASIALPIAQQVIVKRLGGGVSKGKGKKRGKGLSKGLRLGNSEGLNL